MLYGALVRLIVKSRATPVGVIIRLEDFRSLTADQQSHFKDPYYLAFQICTRGAAVQAGGLYPPEKVSMVYAYNKEFGTVPPQETYSVNQAGRAEQLWHIMKDSTDYGSWMGAYSSSTPSETVQLQAADLLAYELAKKFENLLTRPKDKMRWGLRQILRPYPPPPNYIRLLDRKELLRIIKENRWPDQTGTEEIEDSQMQSAQQQMAQWFVERTERGTDTDDEL